ncbi:hypothetical protein ACTFIU_007743 [Dictyostelium citrinum]
MKSLFFNLILLLIFLGQVFCQTCPSGTTLANGVCVKQVITQITTATCRSGSKTGFYWGSGSANPCPSGWAIEYPVKTATITNNQLNWYYCADILDVGGMTSEVHFSSVLNCGNYLAYTIATITFSPTNRYLVSSFCSNDGDMVESNSKPTTTDASKNLCAKGKGTITSVMYLEIYSAVCPNGYSGTAPSCTDINECATSNGGCAHTCSNTAGGFTCSCRAGYTLASDKKSCTDINECATSNGGCAHTCTNTAGGFTCSCRAGYSLASDKKSCTDINECATSNGGCAHTCTNSAGSFTCSCNSGYALGSDKKSCTDINECATSNGGCSQVCTNSPGSFACSCNAGYALGSDKKSCTDINECATSNGGCSQVCTNNAGSFTCSCNSGYALGSDKKSCTDINECATSNGGCAHTCTNSAGSYTCSCNSGYALGSDKKSCTDINECATSNGGCSQVCTNSAGSFACSCNSGYLLGSDKKSCTDINECATSNGGCSQVCTNSVGGYSCSCNSGYLLSSDGKTCTDINECTSSNGGCSQVCTNSPGSFSCSCNSGYLLGSDGKTCTDINECSTSNGGCSQVCTNSPGSFSCSCNPGYTLSSDGKTCVDVNECLTGNGGCGQICTNSVGSYSCSCNSGYTLNSDKKTCTDVNECLTGNGGCGQVCTNSAGSFGCSCVSGYSLNSDKKTCTDVNECLTGNGGCDQICTNSVGSYQCSCNSGYTLNGNKLSCDDINECDQLICGTANCTNSPGSYQCSCPGGYSFTGSGCIDIDECQQLICGTANCTNSPGSYQCSCPNGYSFTGSGCIDIDECSTNNGDCEQICTNSQGSYQCSCNSGYLLNVDKQSCDDINECDQLICGTANCTNTIGSYQCSCPNGYSFTGSGCIDTDECLTGNGGCEQICTNSIGSFSCSCNSGYTLNGDNKNCDDIDECFTNNGGCDQNCANSPGSFQCSCDSGYSLNQNNITCDDVDECKTNNGDCSQVCTNSVGSFQCSCNSGYTLNENKFSCDDIDECVTNNGDCQQICINSIGSFQCSCNPGYSLNQDDKNCDDVDECSLNNGGCSQVCINSIGSFECSCNSGYLLNENKLSCDDVDECENGDNKCTGEFTSCQNTDGSYFCVCPSNGFSNNGTYCEDIDECSSNESNECSSNTICENRIGSYVCQCNPPEYSHSSPFTCEPKPIITNFYQKPSRSNIFVVEGINFVEFDTKITVGEMNCNYAIGNDTYAECSSREGKEVIGNVIVEANNILSDPFNFIGAPFIVGYSHNPPTIGNDLITITGRNFPTSGSIEININSIGCPLSQVISSEQITCTISEGSGSYNYIRLFNESVTNTDTMYITYANPIITSTSKVFSSGGILTVFGENFGLASKSFATLDVGNKHCSNVEIKSHSELTCELEPTSVIYSQLIDLVVDNLPVANDYYFTYSTLEVSKCPLDCSGKGECTPSGCVCDKGFTGVSCNETAVEIDPIPPTIDIPSIGVGSNNSENGYGYKITIIRIEELDFSDQVQVSIDLLQSKWGRHSTTNQWTFNITLENQSYLEATFEYFKQSRNLTFASNSFVIPSESIKLSFKTQKWPFIRKLNSLRVVIQTETILLNEDVNQCSIDEPIISTYNQHLWTTTENPETGMVARFVSYASVDGHPVIAHIESLESPSRTTSVIGISVPYFKNESLIDPDFGMLLNVNQKPTGVCEDDKTIDWKLATGVSIGGAAAVGIAGVGAYLFRDRKKKKQLHSMINKK